MEKSIRFLVILSFCLFFASCSNIQLLSRGDASNLYRAQFLVDISKIKNQYRQGNAKSALSALKRISETSLLPSEKALRRNLIGVILFSTAKYEPAIDNFDKALSTSGLDESLTAQIYLNLASSYFKLDFLEKSFATIMLSDFSKLNKEEASKLHLLKYNLSKKLEKPEDAIVSLVHYLGNKNSISDLRKNRYSENLITEFFSLSSREKLSFLKRFEKYNYLCTHHLGYLEAEKLYYNGNSEKAKDVLEWITEATSERPNEITELVENFFLRIKGSVKINPISIGVVLPLSGKKKNFAKRVLLGIDSAINEIKKSSVNQKNMYNIHIKDSKGSGVVGAFAVKELIQKHHVAVIIGGLFSSKATVEYLEAKKHGVFYVSLSQIYLPKEQKNHLLLEIPGSIESQMNQLFSDKMLDHFGKRTAIIYPRGPMGDAYINEFWRKAKINNVEVNSVLRYNKNQTDYRDPIKNLLGLKFTRERQEEMDLYSEIHALEKNTSARRIQTLRPQIDFDWVFIPAFPKDAIQIIPSFSYYDAFKLNIVGGPSWRSNSLSEQNIKLGRLYFIGDDVENSENNYIEKFAQTYKVKPRLIEMMAYDSFTIVNTLLKDQEFESRAELNNSILEKESFSGLTGKWLLEDDVWIKNMVPLMLRRGKIRKIFEKQDENSVKNENKKEVSMAHIKEKQ